VCIPWRESWTSSFHPDLEHESSVVFSSEHFNLVHKDSGVSWESERPKQMGRAAFVRESPLGGRLLKPEDGGGGMLFMCVCVCVCVCVWRPRERVQGCWRNETHCGVCVTSRQPCKSWAQWRGWLQPNCPVKRGLSQESSGAQEQLLHHRWLNSEQLQSSH